MLMTSFLVQACKSVFGDCDYKDGIEKMWDDMKTYLMFSNLQEDTYSCLLHMALVMTACIGVANNKIAMSSYFTNEKMYNETWLCRNNF